MAISYQARNTPSVSLDLDLDLLSIHIQSGEPNLSLSAGLARRFADFLTSGSASPMTCCAGVGDAAVCVWAEAYYGFQQSRRRAVVFGESAGFLFGIWCGYVFYRTHGRKCWRCAARFGGSEVENFVRVFVVHRTFAVAFDDTLAGGDRFEMTLLWRYAGAKRRHSAHRIIWFYWGLLLARLLSARRAKARDGDNEHSTTVPQPWDFLMFEFGQSPVEWGAGNR